MAEDYKQLECSGNSRFCLGMSDYKCCGTSENPLSSSEPDYNCCGTLENARSSPEPKKKWLSLSKGKCINHRLTLTAVTQEVTKFSRGVTVIPKNIPLKILHEQLGYSINGYSSETSTWK